MGIREVTADRRPFTEILTALERGETDLYAATTRTEDRENYAVFSDAYEHYPVAIAGSAKAGLIAAATSLEGIRVTAVWNGEEALEILQRERFDGVLMDIQMPGMDGYQTTREIRDHPGFEHLPIIALTANAMASDRDKAKAAGMNDHIGKPLSVEGLFDTMARWITPAHPSQASQVDPETVQPPFSFEGLVGIDTELGLRFADNVGELYRRMLMEFLKSQRGFSDAFRAARRGDTPRAAVRLAHSLKGNAGTVGALAVQRAARQLESACERQEADEEIDSALRQVETELRRVIAGLEKYLSGSAA